ncbi:MAG TPA: cation diffusion facilitator family transporter [candidate division Zixibacteria bacterium]|nr:cation transporter [candidate division Zixibacteria bacterium]MDD4916735.1 cation diffusion facilitator family transporter [candidate division Zixibacteria bacterium]MDM7973824.1 cation diffusion facilitator family transporter [candidate division Zixibacteria bacterium]HOD65369.1 cation diffusion facilitator family transporter [candidate division Zixibacteria bacterium]HOZ07897.1 cation diffusion facilitator family transporter [candidate division Zixibacteria bacterium]
MAHTHPPASRTTSGARLGWAILFNTAITAAEIVGGLISGYLALLADAVHNLSDVAALGLAWLGWRGSRLPATKRSTFGFLRVEVITALVSAVALVVVAVFILIEAYRRFLAPQPISHPVVFLTVAAIGLLGNLFSIWILHAERSSSLNMKTAFLHMFYDALSSVVVIAGGLVMLATGWYLVDVILSAAIAVMIFWSSWLVIREAAMILLEAVPAGIEYDAVIAALRADPAVVGVHDLHIWSLSSREVALSCHVCVDPGDLARGPEVIARLSRGMQERFAINHSTMQLETEECGRLDANGMCRRPEIH